VIQIEKFAPHRAANSGEFLDHHTRRITRHPGIRYSEYPESSRAGLLFHVRQPLQA